MNDTIVNGVTRQIKSSTKGLGPIWFIRSAAVFLLITGGAKVWAAFGGVALLSYTDPIVGLKFWQLMLAVGVLEIVVAVFAFISRQITMSVGLVAWLSTNFIYYRIAL